ncbi:hypothetical protein GCM10027021_10640 [Dyella kyungheensis]
MAWKAAIRSLNVFLARLSTRGDKRKKYVKDSPQRMPSMPSAMRATLACEPRCNVSITPNPKIAKKPY